MKRPAQVLAELDRLAEAGVLSVYFVDDNFIGNQKAVLELLPHLVEWQTPAATRCALPARRR